MIQSFADKGTADVYNGANTKDGRKICPSNLLSVAVRKLDMVESASRLQDLRAPPGNRLEALKGNRKGQHSIRINAQFRICFFWRDDGPNEVEIIDYHE